MVHFDASPSESSTRRDYWSSRGDEPFGQLDLALQHAISTQDGIGPDNCQLNAVTRMCDADPKEEIVDALQSRPIDVRHYIAGKDSTAGGWCPLQYSLHMNSNSAGIS